MIMMVTQRSTTDCYYSAVHFFFYFFPNQHSRWKEVLTSVFHAYVMCHFTHEINFDSNYD